MRSILRRTHVIAPTSLLQVSRRDVATEAYVAAVSGIQKELAATRSPKHLQRGRTFMHTEAVTDAKTEMDPEAAAAIANAAVAFKVTPQQTPALGTVLNWALQPDVVEALNAQAIARLCHCAVTLHTPEVFDLLTTYLWRVVDLCPTADAATLSQLCNAYGRAGVGHDALYAAIVARGMVVLHRDQHVVTIANAANVAHALSRVGAADEALFQELKHHALRLQSRAVPLVIATVLDAFAAAGIVDDELFSVYETIAADQLGSCPPALLASLVNTLATAGRTESPLFAACAAQALSSAHGFDPASIATLLDAHRRANSVAEELFGTLAERASKLAHDFRIREVSQTLLALSHFHLYDAELFPLMAARVVALMRQKTVAGRLDVGDAVGILVAFASVREKRDDLLNALVPVITSQAGALPPTVLVDALWAATILGVRGEHARRLATVGKERIEEVRAVVSTLEVGNPAVDRWAAATQALRLDRQ